ncbi:MAG: type II toxin-antitoxin system prevent-host-death family antitoxin [Verrucomicrobia bacterium]|nr:type II toxin-antitoxin system prevent-host-death family antitoxin [Verrucomicrobiota bacterium]
MVNIADMKARFSRHLALVQKGAEICVCRHNKPVARMVPLRPRAALATRGGMKGALTSEWRITGDWDGVTSLFSATELRRLGDARRKSNGS